MLPKEEISGASQWLTIKIKLITLNGLKETRFKPPSMSGKNLDGPTNSPLTPLLQVGIETSKD